MRTSKRITNDELTLPRDEALYRRVTVEAKLQDIQDTTLGLCEESFNQIVQHADFLYGGPSEGYFL